MNPIMVRASTGGGASVLASRLVRSLAPPNWSSAAWFRFVLVLSSLGLACCATRLTIPNSTQLETIRSRSEMQFERAIYLKPAITNSIASEAERFAPLLIIEAKGANANPAQPEQSLPRKISFHSDRIQLNGKWHEQKTYWWKYPRRRDGSLVVQGVRMTLNSAGSPVIWEVPNDTSGAQVIFVSQSVEAQALREFGGPQSGRRFAVERALIESPKTIVARVIEDGPTPMGPIIYLRGGSHDVTTVICRCMDSQARELVAQFEYELVGELKPGRGVLPATAIEQHLRLPKTL